MNALTNQTINNNEIYFTIAECILGKMLVAMSQQDVCAIFLSDDPAELTKYLQNKFPHSNLVRASEDKQLAAVVVKILNFIEMPTLGLDLPLSIQGTSFQQRVWQALKEIPLGSTVSYTQIAHRIGAPKSARAVARACAANLLAIAIPCHRVIRSDGALSGYRWGVNRKQALLNLEAYL